MSKNIHTQPLLSTLTGLVLLGAGACTTPPPPAPNEALGWDQSWHGHVSYPLGFRRGDDDLGDAQDMATLGFLDMDLQPPGSPVSFVIQVLGSFSDEVPDNSQGSSFDGADYTWVTQLNLGLRKVWYRGAWQPYVGGGVSFVGAGVADDDYYYYYDYDYDDDDDYDSDSDFGGWLGVGIHYSPGGGLLIGLSTQYLFDAEVELEGRNIDASGLDVMVLLGYGF